MNSIWHRQSAQDFILSILFILSKFFLGGGQEGPETRKSGLNGPNLKSNPTITRNCPWLDPDLIRPQSGLDPP
jgi:hypothetical protein